MILHDLRCYASYHAFIVTQLLLPAERWYKICAKTSKCQPLRARDLAVLQLVQLSCISCTQATKQGHSHCEGLLKVCPIWAGTGVAVEIDINAKLANCVALELMIIPSPKVLMVL